MSGFINTGQHSNARVPYAWVPATAAGTRALWSRVPAAKHTIARVLIITFSCANFVVSLIELVA